MRGAHPLGRGRELGAGGAIGTGAGGATRTGAGGATGTGAGRITGAVAGSLHGATVLVDGCVSRLPRTTASSHTSMEPRPVTVTIEMLRIAGPNAPAAMSICAGEQKPRFSFYEPATPQPGRPWVAFAGSSENSRRSHARSHVGASSPSRKRRRDRRERGPSRLLPFPRRAPRSSWHRPRPRCRVATTSRRRSASWASPGRAVRSPSRRALSWRQPAIRCVAVSPAGTAGPSPPRHTRCGRSGSAVAAPALTLAGYSPGGAGEPGSDTPCHLYFHYPT